MKPNTMTALEKSKPEEGLWMVQAPVPEIGSDDVLIRINKTGICGTDIHIWNWDEWASHTVPYPMIAGHEFAGEIVEIGKNVKGLKVGQRCSGEGHLIGNDSRQSRAGKFHLDHGTRGIGVNEQGAFAQYLKLPSFNVIRLNLDFYSKAIIYFANSPTTLTKTLMKNMLFLTLIQQGGLLSLKIAGTMRVMWSAGSIIFFIMILKPVFFYQASSEK